MLKQISVYINKYMDILFILRMLNNQNYLGWNNVNTVRHYLHNIGNITKCYRALKLGYLKYIKPFEHEQYFRFIKDKQGRIEKWVGSMSGCE